MGCLAVGRCGDVFVSVDETFCGESQLLQFEGETPDWQLSCRLVEEHPIANLIQVAGRRVLTFYNMPGIGDRVTESLRLDDTAVISTNNQVSIRV